MALGLYAAAARGAVARVDADCLVLAAVRLGAVQLCRPGIDLGKVRVLPGGVQLHLARLHVGGIRGRRGLGDLGGQKRRGHVVHLALHHNAAPLLADSGALKLRAHGGRGHHVGIVLLVAAGAHVYRRPVRSFYIDRLVHLVEFRRLGGGQLRLVAAGLRGGLGIPVRLPVICRGLSVSAICRGLSVSAVRPVLAVPGGRLVCGGLHRLVCPARGKGSAGAERACAEHRQAHFRHCSSHKIVPPPAT